MRHSRLLNMQSQRLALMKLVDARSTLFCSSIMHESSLVSYIVTMLGDMLHPCHCFWVKICYGLFFYLIHNEIPDCIQCYPNTFNERTTLSD